MAMQKWNEENQEDTEIRDVASSQLSKALEMQQMTFSDVEGIIRQYVIDSYPTAADIPPNDLSTQYWSYSNSLWYTICLMASLEPSKDLKVKSPISILLAMLIKVAGPLVTVIAVASMAATFNWLFCVILFCIVRKPKKLADALTASYQRRLVIRDFLIMLFMTIIFLATLAVGVHLHTLHREDDMVSSVATVLQLLSLTAVLDESANIMARERRAAALAEATEAGKSIRNARRGLINYKMKMTTLLHPDGTLTSSRRAMEKTSLMEVLYWISLLLILNSALAGFLASAVRFYQTWRNSRNVVATPAELRSYLQKEKAHKQNQFVYHAKSE
ncbi:unnamed protein product [Nippostrongylus brasiliensis]|uniref:G_PROTEIN_RECEP_F1_2 domain-containing protein n=1 Tax=Nippostrongylus brasiliensis TaxID=27835 RepID=A0A0N4XTF3_NIPBR|nr:unnamed protein product [Nippostrongylus brasiliensis]